MYMDVILFTTIGLILFGLVRSTESVLEIRQNRRDQGDDPKIYL
jgi:hypothetical protein